MPEHRGITITLQSQYDARSVPEYPLPSTCTTASSTDIFNNSTDSYGTPNTNLPPSSHVSQVYIPVYPGSQVWINYRCPDPRDPTTEPQATNIRYYYFKLSLRGECLQSWGIGSEDGWEGKVSFAICNGGSDFSGADVLERRIFCFSREEEAGTGEAGLNIDVFRSKGRRREAVKHCQTQALPRNTPGCGFHLKNAGILKRAEPQRRYSYALIDPVDEPFATFKYYCKTAAQLVLLGFGLKTEESEEAATCLPLPGTPNRAPQPSPKVQLSLSQEDPAALHHLAFPPGLLHTPKAPRPVLEPPNKSKTSESQEDTLRRVDGLAANEPKRSDSDIYKAPDRVSGEVAQASTSHAPEVRNAASRTGSILSKIRRKAGSRDKK